MSSGAGGNPSNHPRNSRPAAEPETAPPARRPDGIGLQWVPKFNGDPGVVARDSRLPLRNPEPWNPWSDGMGDFRESSQYNGSRLQKSYIVTEQNRVMKITEQSDGRWQVVWTRWRA